MKRKIKEDDYIRNVNGDIGKCIRVNKKQYDIYFFRYNEIVIINDYIINDATDEYIIKSSKNIIDLLQIGDIITISSFEDPLIMHSEDLIKAIKQGIKNKSYEITSILTYENYNASRYKI